MNCESCFPSGICRMNVYASTLLGEVSRTLRVSLGEVSEIYVGGCKDEYCWSWILVQHSSNVSIWAGFSFNQNVDVTRVRTRLNRYIEENRDANAFLLASPLRDEGEQRSRHQHYIVKLMTRRRKAYIAFRRDRLFASAMNQFSRVSRV